MYNVIKLTNPNNVNTDKPIVEYIATSKSVAYFREEFHPTIVAKEINDYPSAIAIAEIYEEGLPY